MDKSQKSQFEPAFVIIVIISSGSANTPEAFNSITSISPPGASLLQILLPHPPPDIT